MVRTSYAITRGQPAEGAVPDGYVMLFENVIVFVEFSPAVMFRVPVVPLWEKVAETIGGAGGRYPASYPWTSAAI